MIFFTINISCLAVNAQDVLEITGPADAFEGEDVEFTVTLNGEPVQARVVFETISPAKFSNQTTGKVNFTMPSVAYDNKIYEVTASILGDITASHSILVKNKTGILQIEFSTDYIVETNEFTITVKDEDDPVIGANVWFNSAKYTTDSNGNVNIIAPDVLVTTNYGIIVNKTGYKSNSTMITINEADLGLKLMEIINPYIVEPGEKDIEITVISKNGGLENVSIDLYYEDSKLSEYKTDNNGKAYITSPSIDNDNYFSLLVSKTGYETYSSEEEIIISLFEQNLASDLNIKLTPSEVYEGDSVTVEVTDDIGFGVQGASIWRGAIELEDPTDSEGIMLFIAPSVFMDREYFVYAFKEGYNFAEATITIRDKSSDDKKLTINIDKTINESEVFYVTVKDSNNILLKDVTVTFNNVEKLTSENGSVSFVAPSVTSNTFYTIEASKYGYPPTSASTEIIDLDSNGVSSRKLLISVAPIVMENEGFTVIVRNDQGDLISGAQVTFKGIELSTDFKGTVNFTAPDVSWDENLEILVKKSGYESASEEITIKNSQEFQFWYLVIAAIVILIIGIVAYFRYRTIL